MEIFGSLFKLYLVIEIVSCYPSLKTQKSYVDEDLVTSYSFYEPEGEGTYAFGYNVDNFDTDNVQFRDEERHNDGTVEGSYGFRAPDGQVYMVRYVADTRGYRATVEGPMVKFQRRKNGELYLN